MPIADRDSDVGLAKAEWLADRDDTVYATVLSASGGRIAEGAARCDRIVALLDVTDPLPVDHPIGCELEDGPLDTVVNNAGVYLSWAVEHASDVEVRRLVDVKRVPAAARDPRGHRAARRHVGSAPLAWPPRGLERRPQVDSIGC